MLHLDHPPDPPARPVDGHKGTFGTVIVIGGSPTMLGAPALCAGAALRCGAGLVKIAAAAGVIPWTLVIEPSATGLVLDDPVDLPAALDGVDPKAQAVLAVGPGLGTSGWAAAVVAAALRGPRTVVLDADGLNLLAKSGLPAGTKPPLVLTPHPGEFRRLADALAINVSPTDPAQRADAAAALALAHRAVVVLKGSRTIVADGRTGVEPRLYTNSTGNPALATAGSGDILTGVIAGLIAQKMDPFAAAALGTYVHGLAADLWAKENGQAGLTAKELATWVPKAMRDVRRAK